MIRRFFKSIVHRYRMTLKNVIISCFYSKVEDKRPYLSAPLLYIAFSQKILGVNRHVPFPILPTNHIGNMSKIHIAENVRFCFAVNGGLHLQGINGVTILEDTLIASGVKIYSANHDFNDMSKHLPSEPIHIGRHCWLGTNCVILPGVVLGDRVIVAAGAVVNKSFPAHSVIGGVPAKLISTTNV